jgi:hypothetical protein
MRAIVGAIVVLLVLMPAAFAQTSTRVTADIPFDFYVADTFYQKGTYVMSRPSLFGVIMVKPKQMGGETIYAVVLAASTKDRFAEQTALVFDKYDATHHFLRNIWVGGEQGGWALPKSRTERNFNAPKLVTSNRPETVTVLARLR